MSRGMSWGWASSGRGSGMVMDTRSSARTLYRLGAGLPLQRAAPSSMRFCRALRVMPSHCSVRKRSRRWPSASGEAVNSSVCIGGGLLPGGFLFAVLQLGPQNVDKQQGNTYRHADVGKVEDGKIQEQKIDIVDDLAADDAVDQVADAAAQHHGPGDALQHRHFTQQQVAQQDQERHRGDGNEKAL